MGRIAFTDGDKIGVIEDGRVNSYESEPIARYREYAEQRAKSNAWKTSGEGARFRGDETKKEQVDAYVNGICFHEGKLVYCFTVNGTSGVYRKDPSDEKAREEHIFSSGDSELLSVGAGENLLAVTCRSDACTAQIGLLNPNTCELSTLTDGDARDGNPSFDGRTLLFESAGVGRNAQGEFTGSYAPAAILSIDPDTLAISEVASNPKFSYVHAKRARDGSLYCIRRPNKERREGNVFLDILLFPFRILKAVFGFLQTFTLLFGGTSLTSGGDNPTKGREQDQKKLYVDGNLIEADKQYKRNKKFKDREYGFIPESWKLVRLSQEGEQALFGGVCDFCFDGDAIVYTDGRHVFSFCGGKHTKLADARMCLCVCCE